MLALGHSDLIRRVCALIISFLIPLRWPTYLKLSLIRPGLIIYLFSRGFRGGSYHKRGGVYIQGDLKPERKKRFETSYSSADQNTFHGYWFLLELQNFIINEIHYNTFGGGLIMECLCSLFRSYVSYRWVPQFLQVQTELHVISKFHFRLWSFVYRYPWFVLNNSECKRLSPATPPFELQDLYMIKLD